jgi:5-methylcytosine-specific restriction protein A
MPIEQQRRYDRERGSAASRGYGAEWRVIRAAVLRDEPACRRCGQPARDVDHIVPRDQGGDDTRTNLQALCKPCHASKSVRDGRWGRAAC